MATGDTSQPPSSWIDDDPDNQMDIDMYDDDDDDLFLDDADADEDEGNDEVVGLDDKYLEFSARRRIEIAREDKWLKSAISDFDELDEFGSIENAKNSESWRFSL